MKENGVRADLLDGEVRNGLFSEGLFFRHASCEKEKGLLDQMVEHHMSCYGEDVE